MSILVFGEISEGKFKKSTLEAVSVAFKIANGKNISVAVIGSNDTNLSEQISKYGASKIIFSNASGLENFDAKTYSNIFSSIAEKENSSLIIFSNTYCGKSIAPRVAAKLKAGIVSGVIDFPTENGNELTVKKSCFSGKGFAKVTVSNAIKILSLTPNSFDLKENSVASTTENFEVNLSSSDFSTKIIETKKVTGKIPLTEAEVVVSGGRGWKGPENWGMIEELSAIFGGATACSKPVADMNWRPHEEHVGQTGITIKPNLYFATGISGAIQHLAGVSSSKVIVVINKDAEAPFFKIADYGIVGDVFEVMPQIIDAAKKLKASAN